MTFPLFYRIATYLLTSPTNHLQAVVASARTLQDINDDRVVPGDFLGVLLLLFFFMVLDRLFYTLGLHLGKVTSCVHEYFVCTSLTRAHYQNS